MRVLVSFEEESHVFMEAMADAIRVLRPNVEVAIANADELETAVKRLDPHLVICSPSLLHNPVDTRLACIELSPELDRSSRFRIGERRWESTNPTLGEILRVVDETNILSGMHRQQNLTDQV